MKNTGNIRSRFLAECQDERSLRPFRASLVIGELEGDSQIRTPFEETMRDWSLALNSLIRIENEMYQKITALNRFFFSELGFRHVPSSSASPGSVQIREVMAAREGCDIALALIYLELAHRAGLPAQASGFPGQVLLHVEGLEDGQLVDLSRRGRLLGRSQAAIRLESLFGGRLALRPRHLGPISNRRLLARFLGILRRAYLSAGCRDEAIAVSDWRLELEPESAVARAERGLLLYELNRFGDAYRDLGHVIPTIDAPDPAPLISARAEVCFLLAGVENEMKSA